VESSQFSYAEKLSKLLKFHQMAMIINSNYLTVQQIRRIILSFANRQCLTMRQSGDKTFLKNFINAYNPTP
jgi:hypothetical protein